ncbi:hypothetical protein Q5752_000475 [Cryptotrichosporon argae]
MPDPTPKKSGAGGRRPKAAAPAVPPPAHEIECIARVTLVAGPSVFSGSELWIGRFVEPRSLASATAKADGSWARAATRAEFAFPKQKRCPTNSHSKSQCRSNS